MKSFREDIVGQLLFLRLNDNRWNASLERLLRQGSPGGILLTAPLPPAVDSTRELLRKIARSLPYPPFLAVRQEGGINDPVGQLFPPMHSPGAVGDQGVPAVAQLGELIGEALNLLAFNTNLAPVLDLATRISEPALRARTFGSDPHHVAQCGAAFLRGQKRHKILAVGKHFPGRGNVAPEKPGGLGLCSKPMAALWREDLFPYRQLLSQLPMVLISSAAYKAYDFDNPRPACRSKQLLEGLLRIKLGYRGLALAYDFESEWPRGTINLGDAAIESVNAGCDMLILDPGRPLDIVRRALEVGLESGRLLPQRVEESLERVRALKRRLSPPTGRAAKAALERVIRRFEILSEEAQREESKIAHTG